MAVSLGGNIRTIWITIRAVNYTQRVFDDINKIMNVTIKTEKDMEKATKNLAKASTDFIAAGTMMVALSAMIGVQLWNLAASSQEGAVDFAELTANLNDTKSALADTMYEILKGVGVLTLVNDILNFLKENKWAQYLVLGLGLLIVAVLAIVGSLFLFNGLVMQAALFSTNWGVMTGFLTTSLSTLTAGLIPLNIQMWQLAGAAAAVGAAFIIFMALKDITGPIFAAIIAISLLTAALWILFVAESAASVGVAAVVGGAAAATAFALSQTYGKFQMGTRSVPYTGPIMAHEGEVIYNPSTNRPLQVGNDIAGGNGQPTTIIYEMPMEIKELHTKADVDELDKYMKESLRRAAQKRK
jgi:hypothetical protein